MLWEHIWKLSLELVCFDFYEETWESIANYYHFLYDNRLLSALFLAMDHDLRWAWEVCEILAHLTWDLINRPFIFQHLWLLLSCFKGLLLPSEPINILLFMSASSTLSPYIFQEIFVVYFISSSLSNIFFAVPSQTDSKRISNDYDSRSSSPRGDTSSTSSSAEVLYIDVLTYRTITILVHALT